MFHLKGPNTEVSKTAEDEEGCVGGGGGDGGGGWISIGRAP